MLVVEPRITNASLDDDAIAFALILFLLAAILLVFNLIVCDLLVRCQRYYL